MTWIPYTQAGIALLLAGAAGFIDLHTGRIPNRLTLAGMGVGLALGAIVGGPRGALLALAAALVTATIPLLLFKFNAMGGGDVKLLAGLGALLGAGVGLEIEILAFFLGVVYGVGIWVKNGQLKAGLGQVLGLVVPPIFLKKSSHRSALAIRSTEIRFGPSIALATLAVVAFRIAGMR